MVLSLSRGVWLVSLLGLLASLLIVYASLPEEVVVQQSGIRYDTLSRETVFYLALALITFINVLVFIIGSLFPQENTFRVWFNGLVITLNLFLVVALFVLNAVNSTEKFDFGRIGFLVYGSVGLVVIWSLTWPLYLLYRKIFAKDKVQV